MPLIVVPIFNAAAALARCLEALDRHCEARQPILLIDDASTDAQATRLAGQFADRPTRRLVVHEQNRGFVATANEGLAASDDDVILLNADAIVTDGWLDALTRCAASDERIATVTPWSNNAEICSLPEFCVANPEPADPDEVARRIREAGAPRYPDLPTGVGFCMLVRRAAVDQLGAFDEAFGRGYGEENDFCRRAVAAGLRNVLCDDAYVVHIGNASFGPEGLRPGGQAMARLLERHPDYEQVVSAFIQEDPLAERRQEIIEHVGAAAFETEPLDFTGERFHPECEREIWYEHYHRYAFASRLAAGRSVLDLASGEGYGSALLARSAAQVVGVDISAQAVNHARKRYHAPNLEFRQGSATAVPLAERSVDLIVSFETIEHLEPQAEMLDEFRRVLRPDGLLVISSPDRRTYSDERDYQNEHHVRELYRDEFEALLRERFGAVRMLGQKLVFQSLIWDPERGSGRHVVQSLDRETEQLAGEALEPLYWLALCGSSEQALAAVADEDLWAFHDRGESVYQHYYHEIRKNMQAGAVLAEREQEIEQLRARVQELENSAAGKSGRRWWNKSR